MQKIRKAQWLAIGSIHEGTIDPVPIIDDLLYVLRHIRLTREDAAKVRALAKEADVDGADLEPDAWSEILDDLTNIAQGYAPDYCTVGMHYGDGADFGVWPDWDSVQADRLTDRESTAADVSNAVEYNDHGNATLWRRSGRRWIECWSCV